MTQYQHEDVYRYSLWLNIPLWNLYNHIPTSNLLCSKPAVWSEPRRIIPTLGTIAYLSESEDVVDEEEHILSLLVPEVLGHGEASKGHTGTGAGRLVHLAVHQWYLQWWSTLEQVRTRFYYI